MDRKVVSYCARRIILTNLDPPPPPVFPLEEGTEWRPEDFPPNFERLIRVVHNLHSILACKACHQCADSDLIPRNCRQLSQIALFAKDCLSIRNRELHALIAKLNLTPTNASDLQQLIMNLQPIWRIVKTLLLRNKRKMPRADTAQRLNPKTRKVRLHLIRAMVHDKYSFSPGRFSAVVNAVCGDAAAVGAILSRDLVERVLREATATEDRWNDESLDWGEAIGAIIYVIALRRYAYDPQARRNSATGQIKSAVHAIGLSVDQGLIKKLLADQAALMSG